MGMQRCIECFWALPVLVVALDVGQVSASGADLANRSTSNSPVFLEEVLVTAQKREQPLADVPIAISALSQQALDDLGVENLQQASNFVPGIRIQEQSVAYTGISIRGVTSDNSAPSQSPRVSVFQNGVDISRAQGANIAIYDLERIEVLRGPQGTLFGRGAEVGALSILQHAAEDDLSAVLNVGAGSFNEQKVQGHINTPIVDGTSALRLAFYQHERDGYVDNNGGASLGGVDTNAARVTLNWQASDAMRWQSWFNYQEDRSEGTPFISFYYPEDDFYREANLNTEHGLGSERRLWDVTVRGDYAFHDNFSITSTSAYRTFENLENFDADGLSLPVLAYENSTEHEQFSQELRLNFDSGERWQGFAGLNYQWEQGSQELTQTFHEGYLLMLPKVQAFVMNPDDPFDYEALRPAPPLYESFAPLTHIGPVPLNPVMIETQLDSVENHVADIFADTTYSINDRWQVGAGLRLSYEDLMTSIETPAAPSPAGLSLLPQTCADGFLMQAKCSESGLTARELSQRDQFWGGSGRVLSRYEFTDTWSSYFSYARGRRPNVLAYDLHSNEDNLSSEVVDSFELGSKWHSLDNRYTLDAAAFYFRYSNFVTAKNNAMPIVQMEDNGEAVSQGIELDARAALGEHWSTFANMAYNDARIVEGAYDGFYFRLAPLWSGAVGISLDHSWGDWAQGLLTLTYSYQSKTYYDDNNDANFGQNAQDSYGLANIRYQISSAEHWQLQLWVNNIADEEFIIDAGNTGELFGLSTFVPGAPRMIGANVEYTF